MSATLVCFDTGVGVKEFIYHMQFNSYTTSVHKLSQFANRLNVGKYTNLPAQG
jgi:hypothetical protein